MKMYDSAQTSWPIYLPIDLIDCLMEWTIKIYCLNQSMEQVHLLISW
jgi:hypothetical protein